MIAAKSLALYKNRPVLVLEVRDRLEIRLEDGSTLRVRDKDLVALHPGPLSALPPPAEGGDFETARDMCAAAEGASPTLPWLEAAELVFGKAGPAEVLACWKEGLEGRIFRAEEEGLVPLSREESAREAEKRAKKEGEAAERAGFVERARRARGRKASEPSPFLPGDERFLAEIEAFASGLSSRLKLAAEIGFPEEAQAAHGFLLRAGRWDEGRNPHGARSGCPLAAPRVELGPELPGAPREDLRSLASWAIDNAWSHDPDDAVSWDGESVWVHVADPAATLVPGCPAEEEAFARGSTLYLPELTSPMLPDEALARYGLGLSPESPALSFRVRLGEDGSVASVEALPSLLRVRRASYGEADRILDEGGEGAEGLRELARIAALRRERRIAQGAIEIEIPEVSLHVRGGEIRLEAVPPTRSSGVVRELMLLAGEAVARWAFERELPFPYYGQESPGDASGLPPGLAGEFAKRRLMRAGVSGPTPTAHRGLGLAFYAQVTSPLRRYQDLLGHMQIRAFLDGRKALDTDEVQRRSALAQAASAATRQAERASDLHWTLAWLLRHPGWEGEGVVVGGGGPGASLVYVPELGHETKLRLGPGRELNDRIRLKAARIDLATLESSFDELR